MSHTQWFTAAAALAFTFTLAAHAEASPHQVPAFSSHAVLQSASFKQLSGKKHVPDAVSDGRAVYLSHAPAEQVYELAIAIPVRNEAALDKLRADQQTRSSASYHKWITVDQFADQFGASKSDYAKVVDYLKGQGFSIEFEHANRLVVSFTGTTEQVERAFHVTMNTYKHPEEDRSFYAPDREPTVSGLSVPLLLIAGLDNYVLPHSRQLHRGQTVGATPDPDQTTGKPAPAPQTVKPLANPPVTCDSEGLLVNVGTGPCGTYTPNDERVAYYGGTALTGSGQQIGILGFGGFYPGDLTGFAAVENNQPVPTVNFALGTACAASCSDGEQLLDVLWSSGMAPGITQINFFTNSSNDLTIINAEASSTLSSVYSCSWGWGFSNHTAEDTDFKEMQTQGQTFLNATGDDGGYNSTTWSFPSGDPYITEVGGTQLVTTTNGGPWSAEYGWPDSSGGVPPTADSYAIPTWQTGVNGANGSSTTKRSDPDIAAEADFELLGCEGSKRKGNTCSDDYGGTSYAAPAWAGFIALANQASVAAGNGTIGFLNEELYETGLNSNFLANFHDVTACGGIVSGEGPGPDCNSSDEGTPVTGFNPGVGFDNVTGWGSPNGAGLISLLTVPTLTISAGPYTTASNITFTVAFPEFAGTVTYYATPSGGSQTSFATCTVASGTCSSTVLGSVLGVGTFTIVGVYEETSTSTKKYTSTQVITIAAVPTNVITFTSVSHNFGTVAVGTAATAYTLQVKNTGTTAYPFVLNFTPAHGFTSANNCPASIAAGGTCEIAFYFTPTATGTVTDTWSLTAENGFTYSPSNGGTLTGGGTSQGGVSLSTAGHNWGTVAVGTTSAAYGVTLSNSTSSAVTLTLGSVTSPFASQTNCGATLAAGASCQFSFTFTPTSTATVSQTYSVSAGGVTITSGGNTVTGIVLSGN